jgi:uncharacterized integral membrane protein
MDKINELSTGDKLIAGGGILLLIASFLPWYKVTVSFAEFSASASANGWEAPNALVSILAVIIGVIMAGAVIASKLGNMQLPALGSSITWGLAYVSGGGACLALVILKFILESSSISYGFFLGFIAAVALAAGGYMLYTEEKGTQPFWSNRR